MNVTKAQRAMLHDEFRKVWVRRDGTIDESMVDYCTKKVSAFTEIDGCIITMDKPHIEKRFCFGYGMQSAYDYDEAQEARDECSKSIAFFLAKNLDGTEADGIMHNIDRLLNRGFCEWGPSFWPWLDEHHYTSQTPDCKLGCIRWETWDKNEWCERQGWRKLTEDEMKQVYQLAFEEQMKFCKRLRTYLKRYGLSKCEYWTYWADE